MSLRLRQAGRAHLLPAADLGSARLPEASASEATVGGDGPTPTTTAERPSTGATSPLPGKAVKPRAATIRPIRLPSSASFSGRAPTSTSRSWARVMAT